MKTIVKKFNIYQYSELNEEAKREVKQWYVDTPLRFDDLTEMILSDLKNLFPNSELEVQYSLNSCQGDGVNIYGNLDIMDLVNMVQNNLCGDTYLKFKDFFSQKEIKTLKYYSDCCGDIELPYNSSCSCCCVDEFDVEYWVSDLRINIDLIGKVQKYVINIFKKYCLDWKRIGYDYFDPDKVDEEEMKEICDINNWWFLEDGTQYIAA